MAKQLYGPINPFYGPVNPNTARPAAKKKASPGRAARPAPSLALSMPAVEEVSPLSLEMPDPLALSPRLQGRSFIGTPSRGGARPGDTKINQLDLTQDLSKGKSQNLYMSGPEYDDLTQAAMGTEPNRALQSGINEQQAMYEDVLRNMPTGMVDLTPLMAMTDAMTGSRFAQSYKAPGDMYDNVKMLSGLQDAAQGSRERLAQLIMNQTGGLKKGQEEEGYKSGLDESQKSGFAVPNPPSSRMGLSPSNVAGAEKWIIGENQKMLKDFSADKGALDSLDRALAGGSVGDIRLALAQAARVLSGEKGVLTEGDLTRVFPSMLNKSYAEFETFIMSNPNIKYDAYMLDGLKRAVAASGMDLSRRYAERHKSFNDQLEASSTYGSLPSLPAIKQTNEKIFAPPPPPPVDTSYEDMMKEVKEKLMRERKK